MAPKTRSRGHADPPQTPVRKELVQLSDRAKKAVEKKWIKGYKLTQWDGKSYKGHPRIKYAAGQTYVVQGDVAFCKKGLHYSTIALDAWARSDAWRTFPSQFSLWEVRSLAEDTQVGGGKNVTGSLVVDRKISDRDEFNTIMSGWVHLSPVRSKYVMNGACLAECGVEKEGGVSVSLVSPPRGYRLVRKIECETKTDPVEEAMSLARRRVDAYAQQVKSEIDMECDPLVYNPDCLHWVLIERGVILMTYCTPFDSEHANLMIRSRGGSSTSVCPTLEAARAIAEGRFSQGERVDIAKKLRADAVLSTRLQAEAVAMDVADKREEAAAAAVDE